MIKTWLLILMILYLSLMGYLFLYYILISVKKREVLDDIHLKSLPKEPFVSIIVPTYNEENNIVECLKTLQALDYSNYEIILSDGNSQNYLII
jgi:cellulose synthase/poly-beta-1,6-N-acetylglucosamine synthase-like glycosyltransferase